MTTITRTRLNIFAALLCCAAIAFSLSAEAVCAETDDFVRIVRHIEVSYHVHQTNPFLMSLAGALVSVSHVGGVKDLKVALFEDQRLDASNAGARFDEIVKSTGEHGWQPLVKSYSRRRGDCTFIYARQDGRDLKLLVVNLEPDEAVVVQVKIDPDELNRFLDDNVTGGSHGRSLGMAFR
ncbi:MAG TPA: hypothetical protein VKL40_14195 [Candidatus Angelobacter sp.]|nr:hypothetical protein [Candidatus Angelobacter sp.]